MLSGEFDANASASTFGNGFNQYHIDGGLKARIPRNLSIQDELNV